MVATLPIHRTILIISGRYVVGKAAPSMQPSSTPKQDLTCGAKGEPDDLVDEGPVIVVQMCSDSSRTPNSKNAEIARLDCFAPFCLARSRGSRGESVRVPWVTVREGRGHESVGDGRRPLFDRRYPHSSKPPSSRER